MTQDILNVEYSPNSPPSILPGRRNSGAHLIPVRRINMSKILEICVDSLSSARHAIAGGADTFLSKNKAKSLDAKLAKMTKWVAIAFIVLTLALSII